MKLPMFLRREKWVPVKTITLDKIKYGAVGDGKLWIHLHESDKGNRKIETVCSFSEIPQEKLDEFLRSRDFYQTKIYRWLNGRYDPEIPRYSDISEEDTANALRGSVG